jgi:hypothetical protein
MENINDSVYNDNAEEDNDEEDDINSGFAGLIRSSFRIILRKTIGKSSIGSYPRNSLSKAASPRTIARSADRIGTLIDINQHIRDSNENIKLNKKSLLPSSILIFGKAVPNFIKSTISGASVFYCYDNLVTIRNDAHVSPLLAFSAGSLGGILNALVSLLWDRIAIISSSYIKHRDIINIPKQFKPNHGSFVYYNGVILSHSLSHGSLFLSYETIKSSICRNHNYILDLFPLKDNHSNFSILIHNLLKEKESLTYSAGFISGGLAGIISETVNSLMQPIEVLIY